MSKSPENIADWLTAARAGSGEALGQVLEACRGYLFLIAQRELEPELRAKGGASDMVQETCLKAHRHFGKFRGRSEPELRAWLRRLLLNHLADFRALYREADRRRVTREVPLEEIGSSPGLAGGIAATGLSPSGVAMENEQTEALRQALARLPADYRMVLMLRHQEGCTFEEIGWRMQRSADAVRKLWARAVERLQGDWGDES